ncbi:hypothetical protein A5886_002535 [Enterococcus sp. 8G7_MSG3316]|uniref:Cof-like hydrolase n=1 Tax=Candidatus Enterococcus testudinis TaxID=1834191 RepID=A0A242A8S4_9ENTE|nr:HAD-IIB family hydrolase [Enterococcus sp. 8G7_MSG3316]OTN77435.1 hypothetical protein A5886_002535 [Enterococcus sp. 8G7_MSG3316]
MQIVFSDIDGTFQEMGHPIPAINKEAIRALQDQGDHFVFVTGRGVALVQEMMRDEEIDCDVIFGNGAGMMLKGQEPVLTHTVPLETLARVIDILEAQQVFYFLHTDQGILSPEAHRYEAQFKASRTALIDELGDRGAMIADYKYNFFYHECIQHENVLAYMQTNPTIKVMKIELMEASDEKRATLRRLIQGADAAIFQSFVQTLEIVDPLATKGAAIRAFLETFPDAMSYGIGDGENDLAMFEAVDISIAVSNASEEIQAVCDRIVDSAESGGVGKFILGELIS